LLGTALRAFVHPPLAGIVGASEGMFDANRAHGD
jgi:hypothetical protein